MEEKINVYFYQCEKRKEHKGMFRGKVKVDSSILNFKVYLLLIIEGIRKA